MNIEIKKVVDELLANGKVIKKECPEEILRLYKYNIVPSGQGALWDQVFTTMVFAEGDLRCMNAYMCWMLARIADDPIFEVPHLKKVLRETIPLSAEFLGTCGFVMIADACDKVKAVLDLVETKEEFKALVEAFTSFVTYYENWAQFYFPWYVGDLFPRYTADKVETMARLVKQVR